MEVMQEHFELKLAHRKDTLMWGFRNEGALVAYLGVEQHNGQIRRIQAMSLQLPKKDKNSALVNEAGVKLMICAGVALMRGDLEKGMDLVGDMLKRLDKAPNGSVVGTLDDKNALLVMHKQKASKGNHIF